VHGGHQHGAAVEVEFPRRRDAHPGVGEQGAQRGQRVVGEVSVPQRIPLALFDDRQQRVELQQQHPAGRGGGGAQPERLALVGVVHDAEAVEDNLGGIPVGGAKAALM